MIPSPSLLTTHVLMLTNQMFGGGKLDLLWHFYLDPLPEGRTDSLKLRPGCSFPANAPSPRHHICFRKIFSPSELQADGKNFGKVSKHFQTCLSLRETFMSQRVSEQYLISNLVSHLYIYLTVYYADDSSSWNDTLPCVTVQVGNKYK